MLLYYVVWSSDNKLTKGKGKLTKDETFLRFTVLCNSSADAHRCLQWYFKNVYKSAHNIVIEDGQIQLTRMTIDSRGFYPHYLLLDGMKEPIYLSNPSSNILRAHKIFG